MRSRSTLLFVGGVIVVLAAVVVGYLAILGPTESQTPPAALAPPPREEKARITHAEGAVEIRLGSGEWQIVEIGQQVGPDTELRTGQGSAGIAYGEALEVELSSASEARLVALENDVAKLVLREGRVVADVKPESGRTVQVGAASSDAVAKTRDGRLHVLTDGKGSVQAAVTRGSARVTAKGETVEVAAGYQTTVRPEQPPQTPMVLPPSLLLKIKWPKHAATKKRRHLVVGTTNPGARVKVGNTVVTADSKGRFRAIVELREGRNQVEVRALDVVGRTEKALSPPIVLDTRAPDHAVDTDPEMWK
ncbi:hypothetical protein ACFL6C_00120 [Myxococcota bacterium]